MCSFVKLHFLSIRSVDIVGLSHFQAVGSTTIGLRSGSRLAPFLSMAQRSMVNRSQAARLRLNNIMTPRFTNIALHIATTAAAERTLQVRERASKPGLVGVWS